MRHIYVEHPISPADLFAGDSYRLAWDSNPHVEEGLYTKLIFENSGKLVVMQNVTVTKLVKEFGTFYEAESAIEDTAFLNYL